MRKAKKSKKIESPIAATMVIDFGDYSDGYDAGLKAAADYIESFDKYVNHAYRLSECLLYKFGRRKLKPRRNKRTHVIVGLWKRR